MKLLRTAWRAFFVPLGPPDGLTSPAKQDIILRGIACMTRGLGGGRWGPLLLTHRQLLWYESNNVWPLRRQSRQIDLAQVASVDEGNLLHVIAGGRPLRLHLKNGKSIRFYAGDGQRKAWIEAIRRELSSRQPE